MPAAGWGYSKRNMKIIFDNYVESLALDPSEFTRSFPIYNTFFF